MNITIREFQQSIINFINETKLPLEVKRLVLLEVTRQVTEASEMQIRNEVAEREKQNDGGNEDAVSEN